MKKPIQLNEHQIKALLNGASMLVVPIEKPTSAIIEIGEIVIWDGWKLVMSGYMPETHSKKYKFIPLERGMAFTEYENFIDKVERIGKIPLQIGQEYFVQEEFCFKTFNNFKWIIFQDEQWKRYEDKDFKVTDKIQDSSQMQEHQSRIPSLIPLEIEVKRVYDIQDYEISNILGEEYTKWISGLLMQNARFYESYNKQYPNQPYEENPYVFIIKVKTEIKK